VKNHSGFLKTLTRVDNEFKSSVAQLESKPPKTPVRLRRFAFAARAVDGGAVVVRVLENTSRVCPLNEYGRFETWTQAQVFASLLNREYGIDPVEARCIVVSATLAASEPAKQTI
jgi:hypothetical protein